MFRVRVVRAVRDVHMGASGVSAPKSRPPQNPTRGGEGEKRGTSAEPDPCLTANKRAVLPRTRAEAGAHSTHEFA